MSLVLGGGAIGALCTLGAAWIKARYARTKVEPTPLPVDVADKFVTCEQCKAHRDHIEAHNEDRAKRMHDRLDPVIRSSASTAEVLRQHLEDHRAERSAKK